MTVERSEVIWGTTKIPYAIRRSARRNTVSIAVEPDGAVVITAPETTSVGRLDGVVREKARWIVSRVQVKGGGEHARTTKEFVSGETFLYLGRQCRLRVVRPRLDEAVRLECGRLVVPAEPGEVRSALIGWYREHAALRLPERVARYHRRAGLEHTPNVLVREQPKRWGSCDQTGTLRFNWRIIQAPMRLVDYVVVHELAHLKHNDHNRQFWALLGRVLPGYEEAQSMLMRVGSGLQW